MQPQLALGDKHVCSYNADAMAARLISRAADAAQVRQDLTIENIGVQASALASAAGDLHRQSYAQAMCVEAVRMIWSANAQASSMAMTAVPDMGMPHVTVDEAGAATATSIAAIAGDEDVAWAAFVIGHFYTRMLPQKVRSDTGAHHTPPAIASHLVDSAVGHGLNIHTAKVLDPAAGAGAFLIPVAMRMANAMAGSDDAIIIQALKARIAGWEIDPFAAWLANVFIELSVIQHVAASGRRIGRVVDVRDSLQVDAEPTYDLVIGNPPFGRLKLEPDVRERFSRGLYGHANLYGLFTDLSLRLTKMGGLIALVTPTSFMGGQYFTKLRGIVATDAPPVSIEVFSARAGIFDDVLQETALTVMKRGAQPGRPFAVTAISRSEHGAIDRVPLMSATLPHARGAPWILPRERRDAELAGTMASMASRLEDWGYRVKTGPLVWNRHKPQLRDHFEPGTLPIIWAECIRPNGQFEHRHEKRNHAPYIKVRTQDRSLITSEPCVVLQRTTAKEQHRRLIAAALEQGFLEKHPGGVVIENHVNMLVPGVRQPPVSLHVLNAFLNTGAADRAYRCISGSVAVSAYELEAMPLPCAGDLGAFIEAVASGDRAAVENEASHLYGLKS